MKQVKAKKTKEIESSLVKIKFMYIMTDKPEEFVDKLEELCREYCIQDDFFFNYDVEER